MADVDVKYAELNEHQERKLQDMEQALNLEREKEEKVIILAVEEMN
ncbi:hypothetical protein MWH25_01640 [Natroniella acetigena]|nr:hypothetical protein [Natroniella acetigena]MCK8826451.1 hypothetical protein [Natroniella acetigena]